MMSPYYAGGLGIPYGMGMGELDVDILVVAKADWWQATAWVWA